MRRTGASGSPWSATIIRRLMARACAGSQRPRAAARLADAPPARRRQGRLDNMPRQRTTLRRLFHYARPYRVRLAWAIVGMVVYAIGSAGLAYLIKPIFDSLLPKQQYVALTAWAIVGVYLLKGVGSYVASYLMADVGQRVVMDLRHALYPHILAPSATL